MIKTRTFVTLAAVLVATPAQAATVGREPDPRCPGCSAPVVFRAAPGERNLVSIVPEGNGSTSIVYGERATTVSRAVWTASAAAGATTS